MKFDGFAALVWFVGTIEVSKHCSGATEIWTLNPQKVWVGFSGGYVETSWY